MLRCFIEWNPKISVRLLQQISVQHKILKNSLQTILAALNLRIDIEEAEREKIKMETEAQNMPDNKSMQNSETSVQVETDTQGTTTIVNIPWRM